MRTDYTKRLKLPFDNVPLVSLYSKNHERLTTGYTRIVIGERGPYVECLPTTINWFEFEIPLNLLWKVSSNVVDYVEYRSIKDSVKLYLQRREVTYAAYKIGMCYMFPFDLYFLNNTTGGLEVVIEKLVK